MELALEYGEPLGEVTLPPLPGTGIGVLMSGGLVTMGPVVPMAELRSVAFPAECDV